MTTHVTDIPIPEVEHRLERLPYLGNELLQIFLPDEIRTLREEPSWRMETDRSARTLVKYPDLRIVLVSMRTTSRMERHRTSARLAIVCLAGHIRLHLPHATVELPAGELLALDRDVPHDVEAIQQSTFLLIISWPDRGRADYRG